MGKFTIKYLLSQVGQKSALLADVNSAKNQTIEVPKENEVFARGVQFAKVFDNGDCQIDLADCKEWDEIQTAESLINWLEKSIEKKNSVIKMEEIRKISEDLKSLKISVINRYANLNSENDVTISHYYSAGWMPIDIAEVYLLHGTSEAIESHEYKKLKAEADAMNVKAKENIKSELLKIAAEKVRNEEERKLKLAEFYEKLKIFSVNYGSDLLKKRIDGGYNWKELAKKEYIGQMVDLILEDPLLSDLELVDVDDDCPSSVYKRTTPTLKEMEIFEKIKDKVKNLDNSIFEISAKLNWVEYQPEDDEEFKQCEIWIEFYSEVAPDEARAFKIKGEVSKTKY